MFSKRTVSSVACGDVTYCDLNAGDRYFVERALRQGATRRQVMSWLMASGATIAAAGGIVTSATEALAATPKKGGKIRFRH